MKHTKSQILPALLIFTVFALCILAVLLGGAQSYQRLTQRNRLTYDSRTCSQYLSTRMRQTSGAEAVSVAPFGDVDALVIRQQIGMDVYLTRVYCYDGWLMELFTGDTGGFSPEDGEKILPARQMTPSLEDGLLQIQLTDGNGQTRQLQFCLRTEEAMP